MASLPSAGVAESIRLQLQQSGSAHARIDQLPVVVTEWRRIAHAVARELGRPVETTARGGVMVHAILTDWPATDKERRTSEDRMRDAVEFAALPRPAAPPLHAL
ncbi:hypothetical protein C5C31_11690 [Rathayibacter rathayi]|uniref:Uncharacterized protein n=1 Tax=Rathayibacter rathayi TaxID=33887 RepID=A0ABX5AE20_RATRA|nr:hypothetical protein C5C16_12000 [Rathayibacter rathayi]PPG66521.1 hypothetical protein C5C02_11230 [Rathayibacter rathayi]PPG74889.1 hypothetical protein C5C23_11805 [Rathayibacter rathayi]PPG75139.1 hypothetical protein C5C15_13385 [Rathayibacter rathayi]PPG87558.1 hypothetical protein C5C47_10290 [Rathayibacter rathayi]